MADFIYLASRSPRRHELLRRIGVPFKLLVDDDSAAAEALEVVRENEPPSAYVRRIVQLKLGAARKRLETLALPDAPILAADTTVALGGTILGKPANALEATAMLHALSGRTHRVMTAIALQVGRRQTVRIQTSRVTFARLSRAQIERYVASGEPFDKAGGYGIQGPAGAFARRIEGSETGIMGLPLYETTRLLRGVLAPWHGVPHAPTQDARP